MSTPNTSLYQTSNSSTSTLRPRNTRLISYFGDETETSSNATATATSTSSSKATPLFPDRGPSPSINRSRAADKPGSASGSASNSRKTSAEASRAASTDIWSSWSSIASSLLGGDVNPSGKGKPKGAVTNPKWMKQDRAYSSSPTTPQWGPKTNGLSDVVPGSLEDRQALLQAKRREALLLGGAQESRDSSGRYKRRDSDADIQVNNGVEHDQDALVYVHKTAREDTLAGVMLRYGCQPDVFRKVNRFWPNDNIQVRNHVFLPVEACSVRGKKVEGPQAGSDLLGAAIEDLAKTTTPGKGALKRMGTHTAPEQAPSPTAEAFPSYSNDNPDLRHDSWVSLPNFPDPVAILRIPRSSLGYFPRARRKSLSKPAHTDSSVTSTPRSSFDNLRHPLSHAAQMSLSQNASPVRRPTLSTRQSSGRPRSSSTTQGSFIEALRGPGGVGTLRGLRTEPSRPGPAEDPLNRKFAQLFPDLAITSKEAQKTLAPPPIGSFRSTPRASMDSVRSARSNSSGLSELAGGVEGWVRKMAAGKGAAKRGAGPMADLIELETTSDAGDGDGAASERDNVLTPTMPAAAELPSTGLSSSAKSSALQQQQQQQQQQTQEDMLNERFPVRGRVRSAYDGAK
ncbi:uncharacterized protein HMPREF1541_01261 [Cyphellophora europaea CBS 101466]|uniref:LysM domain-containing protein n=1 Tax=Cyphellophora europaea (strain CBS 101466) TaxID=1220924 RepID=W2SEB1_CYPE1|nr:uncharacterized protein HMPREF1541_01261 [Cyphellophora europaea CBS 101466]ETN47071.1 hypothetical protein HMPREF1541_01261 [Cyphellophora europaea CBS 101466]